MKVDFFCIGAQKAGTTTLHDILNTHPDIYLPINKEAQFFDVNEEYEKGLEYYFKAFFKTYKNEKFVGNINPNLQLENRSIDRIIDCFGTEVKIIFILRDPVNRAYSHYLMSKRRGHEDLTFIEAVKQEHYRLQTPQRHKNYGTNEPCHYEKNHLGYIYRSHYLDTVQYLLEKLPRKNVKFLLFEDFISNKQVMIQDLLKFLKVSLVENLKYEVKSNPASMPQNIKLRNFFSQPNKLKSIAKRIINEGTRKKLRKKINNFNNSPLTKEQKTVDLKVRSYIYKEYFKDEVDTLERLIALNLDVWKV